MLRLERVGKRFGTVTAVDELSLDVEAGELLSLLGPSGCGKTTTLRMIAGFETPTSGRILLADRDVTAAPPQRRGMGMVFQNYALFPHLSVRENVAFGLEATRVPRGEIDGRVRQVLRRVDLEGYEDRRVQQLSGGQQQRVALARALAPEPPVLLLDEPLSNLDAALRERTRTELRMLLKQVGITAIFVTHDQEEAFALSDRIAVLDHGRLEQVGTPETLYHDPATPFVAAFVGKANFLPGRLLQVDGDGATCRLDDGGEWQVRGRGAAPGAQVRVMVRPEGLTLDGDAAAGESPHAAGIPVEVVDRRFAGSAALVRVRTPAGSEILVAVDGRARVSAGDAARLRLRPGIVPIVFPPEPGS
jgi:iron(III) transport system ATP-binding protein